MNNNNQFTKKIQQAITGIDAEIQKEINGETAVDSIDHLIFMKSTLSNVLEEEKKSRKPKHDQFGLGLAHLIIDQWPLNNELGILICDIEYLYAKLQHDHSKHFS